MNSPILRFCDEYKRFENSQENTLGKEKHKETRL